MHDEKNLDLPSTNSSLKAEHTCISEEFVFTEDDCIPSNDKKRKNLKHVYLTKLFGSDYNITEAKYVIVAACLIALNSGFVNGVSMSGLLYKDQLPTDQYPKSKSQMVAGFAGAYSHLAIQLVDGNWVAYMYYLCLIFSYAIGNFIAAILSPRAKSYVIDPGYGPTFLIGGTMLLAASLLARFEQPSRFVFFFVAAANGIQNGIASIYSANLIRCTLTGATTDIAIVIAQCIHGNYKGLARGTILAGIIFFFWIGGIIGILAVEKFTALALLANAFLFYLVGAILILYLVKEVGVSLYDAVFGTWKWKKMLEKLDTEDGALTHDKLMNIFDLMDDNGDGNVDADELEYGLRRAKVRIKDYQIKRLFRAADDDGNGVIDRAEWEELSKKML